jgi:hypothetical protein
MRPKSPTKWTAQLLPFIGGCARRGSVYEAFSTLIGRQNILRGKIEMENKHMKPDADLQSILTHLAEDKIPSKEFNLCPAVRSRVATDQPSFRKRLPKFAKGLQNTRMLPFALVVSLFVIGSVVILLATPQGRAWAQSILQFFTRAQSDALPVQTWQLTPQPTLALSTNSPDPANILEAKLSVKEVEAQSGFEVKEPSWLPEHLSLVGATYDPQRSMVRIFYRLEESSGLVLKEEFYARFDTCALCNQVGASASIETVQVGDEIGEYVQGVWKLTENGPIWENDPYLQTLRWQTAGIAYELQYMGPPEVLTKEVMVSIANSLK